MSATTITQQPKIRPRRVVSHKFRAQDFVRRRNNEKVTDHYSIGKLLGDGQFGEVFLGTVTKSNGGKGDYRAVKRIQKELLSVEDHEEVFNEFLLLKQMDHPNICKMYEFFEDEESFWFVQEFCGGGELFDELERIDIFPESSAALIMKQVLSSVHYCHTQKRVIHRDLKLENILLEGPHSCEEGASYKPMVVKLIDFGLGTHFQPDQYLTSPLGSMHYIAPEVLEQCYNYKCDIWSCGVILFIMLSGYAPFEAPNDRDMRELIMMGHYNFNDPVWENVSDEAKDFISYLLTYEPEKRPDAAQALQHPWIQNAYKAHAQQFKGTKSGTDAAVKFLTNCRSFEAASKLKQATCAFMTSQLVLSGGGNEQRQGSMIDSAGTIIGEIFRAMDLDADGRLSREELQLGFLDFLADSAAEPLTVEEVDDVFQRINLSSSGSIEYSEFVVACMGLHDQSEPQNQQLLKQAFDRLLDKDGSGYISRDKLRKEMAPFYGEDADEAVIRKIIDQADADKDGQISWDDFQTMMTKTATFVPPKGATPLTEYKYSSSRSLSDSDSPQTTKEVVEPVMASKSGSPTLPAIPTISEEDEEEETETVAKKVQPTSEKKEEPKSRASPVVQPTMRRRSSANGPKARLISAIYEKNLEDNRARGLDPFSYVFKQPEKVKVQKRKLPRTRRLNFEELMKKANAEIKFDAKAAMEDRNAEITEFKTTNAGRAKERQSSLVTMLQQEKQVDKRDLLQELETIKGQPYNAKERRNTLQNSFTDTMTRRLEQLQREKQRLELENVKKTLRDDHAAKKRLFESWHQADKKVSKVERRTGRLKKLEELKHFQETFEPSYPLKTNAIKLANLREAVPASAVHRRPSRKWTRRISGKALVRDTIEENVEDKETSLAPVEVRRMFDRSASQAVLSVRHETLQRLAEMQPKAKTKKSRRKIEPIRRINSFDSDQEQEERDSRLDELAPVEENKTVPTNPHESLNRSMPNLISIPEGGSLASSAAVKRKGSRRNSLTHLAQIFEKGPEKPDWLQTRASTCPSAVETKATEAKKQIGSHQLPSVSIKPRSKSVTTSPSQVSKPSVTSAVKRHSIAVQISKDTRPPLTSPASPITASPVSVAKETNDDSADKKELDLHQACAPTKGETDTNENSMVGLVHTGTTTPGPGPAGCSLSSFGGSTTSLLSYGEDSVSSDVMLSPVRNKMEMSAPELGGRRRRSRKNPNHKRIITPKNEPRMRAPGTPTTPTPGKTGRRLSVATTKGSAGDGAVKPGRTNRRASATATMTSPGGMTEEQKQFLQMAKDRAMKSKLVG